MKKVILMLAVFCLAAFPAQAAKHCYDLDQVKAERILRLHTEMMVITVTCKQSSVGRDLGRAYTDFTKEHASIIKKAEKSMKDYYAAIYGGDGLSRLDSLRTKLANEYGQQVAAESAPLYCEQRRDIVTRIRDYKGFPLADESARVYATTLTDDPPCSESIRMAAIPPARDKKSLKKTKGKAGS
ncbi:MAG: hypothetical protein EOM37_03915 [Proteobacteria bacterium]|nr:hypothetical protein [Alphaproteobacteria bacterium]NCC03181.1 hypothetical protein [Pseudomonadota bacterium]